MIGLIGAMRAEVETLITKLTDTRTHEISGITFYTGRLEGKEVVLAACGVGKVFAALCAQTMILHFHPEYILHTGVAGATDPTLSVGDIVIATALVQHDMDTSALGDPKGWISGIDRIQLPTDPALRAALASAADALHLSYKEGVVASGDQFVATARQKQELAHTFDAAVCEMEGAAIAQVCYVNQVPLCVLRAVSDSLSGDAAMEYSAFLPLAVERAVCLILRFLKN